MNFTGWPLVSAVLLFLCLGSFGWGMRNFFSAHGGKTSGMKLIQACGSVFAVLHLGAILLTPEVEPAQAIAAAVLYVCSLMLFWLAIRANAAAPLSAAFTADIPLHLMQRGPYRFIRHPFYCSYLLTWSAGVIATGRLWLVPSVAVMLAIYWRAARAEEEKFARSPLADAYRNYRLRTGMFGPNPVKMLRSRRLLTREEDAAGMA